MLIIERTAIHACINFLKQNKTNNEQDKVNHGNGLKECPKESIIKH